MARDPHPTPNSTPGPQGPQRQPGELYPGMNAELAKLDVLMARIDSAVADLDWDEFAIGPSGGSNEA